MIRVLFVCLGNICRSPMAEAVFAHLVREAGLEDFITVDSAGTGHWHEGEQPHRGTRAILNLAGIAYHHRARVVNRKDLEESDYILAMDRNNLRDLQMMCAPKGKLCLFLDFAEGVDVSEVPDPYYDGRFQVVYDLVVRASEGLLEAVKRELLGAEV